VGFVANDVCIHDLLKPRLVNRTMNTEVVHAIETAWLFSPARPNWESPSCPSCHPLFRKKLPISSYHVDFFASFIFIRPHLQDPWIANASSFLNSVVDELLREDGLAVNYVSRKELLQKPCHHLFEINHWKQQTWWFAKTSELDTNPTDTLEFSSIITNVLLGPRKSLYDLDVPTLLQKRKFCFRYSSGRV